MLDKKLHILLIEDDEDDYVLTRDLLLETYHGKVTIEWVNKYKKALERIKSEAHDVYLVDYHLGNDTGIELIEEANRTKQFGPFIVLTGEKNHSTDSKAIKAGAEDYLVKGHATSMMLERSIRYAIERHKTNKEHDKLLVELAARKEAEKNALKTTNLLDFTSELLETVTPTEVADVFIKKGLTIINATAGSIVLLDDSKTLRIVQASGYDKSTIKKWSVFDLDDTTPIGKAILSKKPIFVNSQEVAKKRYPFLKSDKGKSWAALPIITRKNTLGAIGLTFNEEQEFTDNTKTYLLTIAQQVAQALDRAKLYELEKSARQNAEISKDKIRFLNEATKILSSSLEYKKTLTNLANIVVPQLAEWCGIDIITEDGKLQNLVVAHEDSHKVKLAKMLQKKYPADLNSPSGVAAVIKSGEPQILNDITQEMIVNSARDEEHLKLLTEIGFKSVMIVPLKGQNKTLGAITFVASHENKSFIKEDLIFAQELAARASTAIDNAILYQKSLEGIRIRDEFLNIAAHELRTPLTSLQLQMQLLLSHITKATTIKSSILQKSLLAGEQQTKRLGNLINNLLDVSRMSNKKIELEKDIVDLSELLKDVISRFDSSLKHSGTKMTFRNSVNIKGKWDKFRLDQVMTNLISNAIKYGEGKPIKITIKTNKNKAVISIKDNGMGMNSEDKKKIFNRFVRTEAAKKYGGLGLGLYISKQIVEAHEGTISVNSSLNKGSEFIIKLPLNP
jgi:signal transduction histidine kinase/response regulator of citrate/malate metabolism